MLCANCHHSKEAHRKEQVNAPRWDAKEKKHVEQFIFVHMNCNAQWCACKEFREKKP